jgi:hypothetical protein
VLDVEDTRNLSTYFAKRRSWTESCCHPIMLGSATFNLLPTITVRLVYSVLVRLRLVLGFEDTKSFFRSPTLVDYATYMESTDQTATFHQCRPGLHCDLSRMSRISRISDRSMRSSQRATHSPSFSAPLARAGLYSCDPWTSSPSFGGGKTTI